MTEHVRIVGCDPGACTGLVCVDVPRSRDLTRARWVGSARVLRPGKSKRAPTEIARDVAFVARLRVALAEWKPSAVVIEEPSDARSYWGAKQSRFQGHGTGTLFLLGKAYGLLVAAAASLDVPLHSYPVKGTRERPGWMVGKTHEGVARMMLVWARALAAGELGDDELMALGLLHFHVTQSG